MRDQCPNKRREQKAQKSRAVKVGMTRSWRSMALVVPEHLSVKRVSCLDWGKDSVLVTFLFL